MGILKLKHSLAAVGAGVLLVGGTIGVGASGGVSEFASNVSDVLVALNITDCTPDQADEHTGGAQPTTQGTAWKPLPRTRTRMRMTDWLTPLRAAITPARESRTLRRRVLNTPMRTLLMDRESRAKVDRRPCPIRPMSMDLRAEPMQRAREASNRAVEIQLA